MIWLLNILYLSALLLVAPVAVWKMVRHGRYRRGLPEKLLGRLPRIDDSRPVVWFHAVSVGEVLQLQKVVQRFQEQTAGRYRVVVTTSTDTGYDLAVKRFADATVTWLPLDFSWSVAAALRRVRPVMVVLMELELWPVLLTLCQRRGIQTALINARIGERSFRGYFRVRRLLRPLLQNFSVMAAQSNDYAERLIRLGADRGTVTVTGSVKFDGVPTDRSAPAVQRLKKLFAISDRQPVLIAGSTQDPEEALAVDVWQKLRDDHPDLRLVIVPRHRERFDAVAALLTDRNVPFRRRSELTEERPADVSDVILLDTIGELGSCWGLADVAFVGGTFGSRGGQNMLEPAAWGAAVLFGPNTWNFQDIVMRLLEHDAAIQMQRPEELAGHVKRLLEDTAARRRLGQAAQQFIRSQAGAVDRTVRLLTDRLAAEQETAGRGRACRAA